MSLHEEIESFANIASKVSPQGAACFIDVNEQIISVTGATQLCMSMIPAGSIPLGVTGKNLSSITGCTSYALGYAASRIDWGSSISNLAGASISSLSWAPQSIAPQAFTQNLVLTANGSSFTGGRIRLAAFFIRATPPTA